MDAANIKNKVHFQQWTDYLAELKVAIIANYNLCLTVSVNLVNLVKRDRLIPFFLVGRHGLILYHVERY